MPAPAVQRTPIDPCLNKCDTCHIYEGPEGRGKFTGLDLCFVVSAVFLLVLGSLYLAGHLSLPAHASRFATTTSEGIAGIFIGSVCLLAAIGRIACSYIIEKPFAET